MKGAHHGQPLCVLRGNRAGRVAGLPFLRGAIFVPCHKLPENRKEKAVAVQEIKTDESYTVIVSDGEKQSTVTVTKDGIRFESEKIIIK